MKIYAEYFGLHDEFDSLLESMKRFGLILNSRYMDRIDFFNDPNAREKRDALFSKIVPEIDSKRDEMKHKLKIKEEAMQSDSDGLQKYERPTYLNNLKNCLQMRVSDLWWAMKDV